MNKPIGQSTKRQSGIPLLAHAHERAATLPDLLVNARRVANTVFAGWHGRRRRGIGENFWQFRPYGEGENVNAIDWRRSARGYDLFVRDHEWQATHTVWVWADESPSMLFSSQQAQASKQSRAMVLALALTEILARSGERIGWLGLDRPIAHRQAAERIAARLIHAPSQTEINDIDIHNVRDFSDIVLFSDFLDAQKPVEEILAAFTKKRLRLHLVHIVDPVEQDFPYSGRVEFEDPESSQILDFGSAQSISAQYRDLFQNHCDRLSGMAHQNGWNYYVHHTDQSASTLLNTIFDRLSNDPASFDGGRS